MSELLRTYLCSQNETFETVDLNAEVSFDTLGKELGIFRVSFGSLVSYLSVGYLQGPSGLRKFVILCHDCFGSDSKLMELQNFSLLIVDSWFILVLSSFCNLLMVDLVLES